jgi:hypothetical protein
VSILHLHLFCVALNYAGTPAGGLCQGGALKEALRRYERLWLPLIAAQAGSGSNGQQQPQQQGYSQLVPPLDVAFLWHLHRLQPGLYEEDCQQLKGRDGKSLKGALHVTPQQVRCMDVTSSRQHWLISTQAWPRSGACMLLMLGLWRRLCTALLGPSLAVPAAVDESECLSAGLSDMAVMHAPCYSI